MANLLPITSSKRFVPGCGADDLAGKGQQLLRRGTFALGQVVSPAQGFGPRPSCGAWVVKRDPGIASAWACRLCWAVGQVPRENVAPREDLRRWCSRRDLNPRPAGQKYRTRQSGGYEPPALPLGDCCMNPAENFAAGVVLCLHGPGQLTRGQARGRKMGSAAERATKSSPLRLTAFRPGAAGPHQAEELPNNWGTPRFARWFHIAVTSGSMSA